MCHSYMSMALHENCPDSVAYSLILRLRGFYIVDCLMKNKMWNNKELIKMIKNISGSERAYEGYLRIKENDAENDELPINEAEKICNYIKEGIKKHEKWLAKRK